MINEAISSTSFLFIIIATDMNCLVFASTMQPYGFCFPCMNYHLMCIYFSFWRLELPLFFLRILQTPVLHESSAMLLFGGFVTAEMIVCLTLLIGLIVSADVTKIGRLQFV